MLGILAIVGVVAVVNGTMTILHCKKVNAVQAAHDELKESHEKLADSHAALKSTLRP